MTDRFIQAARRNLADSKRWGETCETAILSGQWDTGELVQRELEAVLKDRPEVIDE